MDNFSTLQSRAPSPTAIQRVVGPPFVGLIINYFLWGIQVTQSYYYYKTYRTSDRTWMKLAVLFIFIVDIFNSVCVADASWAFLVKGWGDPDFPVETLGWGVYLISLTDTLTTSIVHFFYAQMIFSLYTAPFNYIWTVIIILLSLTQLTAGIGQSAFMASISISIAQFDRIKIWVFNWLIPASACDIIITALMSARLQRSRTGFKRTDDVITKLIQLTVETGLATTLVQLGDLVAYIVWPVTPYHAVFAFMAPKVYSNSMLALLNSRQPRDKPTTTSSSQWDSRGDKGANSSIQIQTAHTISRAADYELGDVRRGPGSPRSGPGSPRMPGGPDYKASSQLTYTYDSAA